MAGTRLEANARWRVLRLEVPLDLFADALSAGCATTMVLQVLGAQHAIERRFQCHVLAADRELRDDLIRRLVAELGA